MSRAEILLNDYNFYRFQTNSIKSKRAAGAYIVSLASTPERLSFFDRLIKWCADHSIDPRHWLHSLFVARHWMFAPPLKQLISPKHLKRYEGMGDMPGYRARIAAEQHALDDAAGRVFDCNRDVSHSAETLKMRYVQLGQAGRCMELMSTETFGYHPKSKVCGVCPIKIACEAMLLANVNFDIMALRRGEITSQQAKTVAVYHGNR